MKLVQQGTSPCLANIEPYVDGLTADLTFDVIEETDAFDGFSRDR
jgi:hypothetical protein